MKFDRDTFHEIVDTLTRNKSRSFLTGFGIFWGVFMLLALVGGGQGLKEILSKNFEGFATNSVIIFPDNTGKAYKGFKKGRAWTMTYNDVERLRSQVPELDVITPVITSWQGSAVFDDSRTECRIKGVNEDYSKVEEPVMYYGRYLNQMDILQKRKVCVIGKKIYKTLFPKGGDPCGKYIKVGNIYFRVVGVDYSTGNMSINGRAEETTLLPISVMRDAYNLGNSVHLICATGKPGITVKSIESKMRSVIAREHYIDPTDSKAILLINTELFFGIMDNLFKGVNFLIWLVGLGTILAGAIGVSNIMMITVKERTTEIGIRRSIGATPKMILSQIIAESIILTLVAGCAGIVFAVFILGMADNIAVQDGIRMAEFQVNFRTAVSALILLTALGVLAGLAPASRALKIKPVDAMKDE
jgi:hypothetical protein